MKYFLIQCNADTFNFLWERICLAICLQINYIKRELRNIVTRQDFLINNLLNKYSLCCSVSMRRGTLFSPIRGYPQGRYPDTFQTHSICQSAHHQGCHVTLRWTETCLWLMLTDFKLVCQVFIIFTWSRVAPGHRLRLCQP